jgi:hypothetical protein
MAKSNLNPTYTWTLATVLPLKAKINELGKPISLSEAYEVVAGTLGYADWSEMKAGIASSTDPEALARMEARGPRVSTVDGSINTKILLDDVQLRTTELKVDLMKDNAHNLVDRIQGHLSSYVIMSDEMESKIYWLLSSIIRPLVYLRDHEGLQLTFGYIRSLLTLNEFLTFAKELVDSDLRHQYVNPVLRYDVEGSVLCHGDFSTKVSAEEHKLLSELISDVLHKIEIENKYKLTV